MTSFKADYNGVGEMLRADFMVEAMYQRAEHIKAYAENAAPVGKPPGDKHPGEYRESFSIAVSKRGGDKKNRAEAQVINDAPHAFYVEYGTSKMEARHILFGAAIAALRDA